LNRTAIPAALAALALLANGCKRSEEPPQPLPPATATGTLPLLQPPSAMPPSAMVPETGAVQQRLAAEERLTAQNPKDVQAWIALGNDYFDTNQAQRAVDAYAKALALQPNNPDVLTDQGVMYRKLQAFDKAVANFQRANQVDPRHVQSIYNLGVVYAFDLKDQAKAIAAWNRVIEVAPQSPQAAQARQNIQELKSPVPQLPQLPQR
jgi:cytochrome c-type biogenesis protein CcmH/NrfG